MQLSISKLPEWLAWIHDVPTLCSSLSKSLSRGKRDFDFHSLMEVERTHLVLARYDGISYLVIDSDELDRNRLKLVSHLVVSGYGEPKFDALGMPQRGLYLEHYWGDRGPVLRRNPKTLPSPFSLSRLRGIPY